MERIQEEDFARLEKCVTDAIIIHCSGEDHVALRAYIQEKEDRHQMWLRVQAFVAGSLVLSFVLWVGYHALEVVGVR